MKNAVIHGVIIVIAQVIAGLVVFKFFTSKKVMRNLIRNSAEINMEFQDGLII